MVHLVTAFISFSVVSVESTSNSISRRDGSGVSWPLAINIIHCVFTFCNLLPSRRSMVLCWARYLFKDRFWWNPYWERDVCNIIYSKLHILSRNHQWWLSGFQLCDAGFCSVIMLYQQSISCQEEQSLQERCVQQAKSILWRDIYPENYSQTPSWQP